MKLLISLGEKQSLTRSYLDQRLGLMSYGQFLFFVSQSHWAGFVFLFAISGFSFLFAQWGVWAPLWRWFLGEGGLGLALHLTDGRVGNLFQLGLICFGLSFLLGFFGWGRAWFCLLVPGLVFANLVSTSLAWSGFFWCWMGSLASLWFVSNDPVWRRDLSRLLFLGLFVVVVLTYFAPWVRTWMYFNFGSGLFHQSSARFLVWLLGLWVGMLLISLLHAVFFHFFAGWHREQKTRMSWSLGWSFFWQLGGARLRKDLLAHARTRLAEYEKIAQDLDDSTQKMMPPLLLSQWQTELKALRRFVGAGGKGAG